MRYFFNGKIEKKADIYSIRIPFNVWEVCKQRDVINADLVLDNKIIDCKLLPEEKGNYRKKMFPTLISIRSTRSCFILPAV